MNPRATRVLLVEGDAADAERIGRGLESATVRPELTRVSTLREAESFVERSLPDLVIAAARLPDGKGIQILPGGKDKLRFPVVIVTAAGRVEEAVDAIRAGAADYVVKSVETFAAMGRVADRALRDWENVLANRRLQQQIAECEAAEKTVLREQRLLRRLLDLEERERKLIAYEIHDGLAQQLAGAQMAFQSLRRWQDQDPAEVQRLVDRALRLLDDSLAEARRLIGGLRPLILDELGIVAAIEYLLDEAGSRHGVEVEFVHEVRSKRLAPPLEAALFRIVQESLTNAGRHSQTQKVRVELVEQGGRIRVEVRDWGVGFDPDKVEENRFGLQGIRQRARLFGGEAAVDAATSRGTRIAVELPVLEKPPEKVDK